MRTISPTGRKSQDSPGGRSPGGRLSARPRLTRDLERWDESAARRAAALWLNEEGRARMASPLRRAKGTEVELTEFSLGPCLGMGAFATVHAAVRKQTGERVAIKISRKAIVGSAEADSTQEAAFFRAEVALMSSKGVGHPNIVRCFGHGTMPCEGGAAGFLVMEMLPGKDLRARLRAPIDLSDVETWSMQLALALAHLHAHGIVHRDVKTSNLMLDHLSELKLVHQARLLG